MRSENPQKLRDRVESPTFYDMICKLQTTGIHLVEITPDESAEHSLSGVGLMFDASAEKVCIHAPLPNGCEEPRYCATESSRYKPAVDYRTLNSVCNECGGLL